MLARAPVVVAALTISLLLASQADAQDRVIGLLTLPEVFGGEACAPFEPRPVPLYAEPASKREVASIRVDQYWSFAPHGGCEGLEVSVHRGSAKAELPTREYAYEAPAAIALDERNGWFKIRLSDGAAWVAPGEASSIPAAVGTVRSGVDGDHRSVHRPPAA